MSVPGGGVHPGVPDWSRTTDDGSDRMAKNKVEKAAAKALEKAKDAVADARRTAKKAGAKAKRRAAKVESELKVLAAKIEKDAAKRAKKDALAKKIAPVKPAPVKPAQIAPVKRAKIAPVKPAPQKKIAPVSAKPVRAKATGPAKASVPPETDVVIVPAATEAAPADVSTPTSTRASALTDEAAERGDLSGLTVIQLRGRAREKGITGYGKFTKAQLIASLAD
ncbi:hypothetical protein ASC59_07530 [Leifsonia sp. Root1293]|nr:hypothetical protein ASC59_07530 [Leifsonia sp. Root1293]KRA11866.1 hypothetical protein ASD61_07530 [Leifsonia sp. Root60]